MPDRIQIGDKWYVAANTARADERFQVLKNGDSFALFDRYGDIHGYGGGELGVYHDDTRFLSRYELSFEDLRPLYLNALVKEDNGLLVVELMNPDFRGEDGVCIGKGTVHLFRAKLLWGGACYEHVRISNYGLVTVKFKLAIDFDADFVDLFEVRGIERERRGERLQPELAPTRAALRYVGLDGVQRSTTLSFDPAPANLSSTRALYHVTLGPGEETHLYVTADCALSGEPKPAVPDYQVAYQRNAADRVSQVNRQCGVRTSNELFNLWLDRSLSDLSMLNTTMPQGRYPYAGVPWYSTTFGRDGILTARECLWVDPSLARGVLAFLAATQATEEDPERDAEPGKILHEARKCEMARTREIPFGRYYGTIDATPLFVALAGAYFERTGDAEFVRSIWPNILAALEWIDRYGDRDGDGFVEYARRSKEGLVQQGWKDSIDSVFHADGELAEAPIALCEVQAYVYEAKLYAAQLAAYFGDAARSAKLRDQAAQLKDQFVKTFWCEELGSYAIAVDGRKHLCKTPSSNAGHCLWTGIATPEHAAQIAERLLSPAYFSGWGVRTIAEGVPRYNPMSYHNGSVWPHDNALIAAGLSRYGHTDKAMTLLAGMYDASLYFDQHRLPELFCGFPRRPVEGPTLYPVACSPQAWASAAVFSLVQSCLGLTCDAATRQVRFHRPMLPVFLSSMTVRGLSVGEASVDLLLERYENNVGIDVLRKQGDIAVVVNV